MKTNRKANREQLIYRIISDEDWRKALQLGRIDCTDADRDSGFMHFSRRELLLETAGLYFNAQQNPLALEIQAAQLGEDLIMEAVGTRANQIFPHLYANHFSLKTVSGFHRLLPQKENRFKLGQRTSFSHD